MNIPAFLDLGADLETHVSKLYEALASLSANAAHAKTLKSLAGDELNHAIILRTGKRYYEEMPDLFAGTMMSPGEVYAATEKAKAVRASLKKGGSLLAYLRDILELEAAFERIHLDSSVKVSESSLKELFVNLMVGDQSHIKTLREMIKSLSEPA